MRRSGVEPLTTTTVWRPWCTGRQSPSPVDLAGVLAPCSSCWPVQRVKRCGRNVYAVVEVLTRRTVEQLRQVNHGPCLPTQRQPVNQSAECYS